MNRLTPEQFKAGLRVLNMSQESFARYTGRSLGCVAAYASGKAAIPKTVVLLLENLVTYQSAVPVEYQRRRRTSEQRRAEAVAELEREDKIQ